MIDCLRGGNPDPCVENVEAHQVAAPARADEDRAGGRIFDRVGNQVLQHPAQQLAVRCHAQRRGRETKPQAALSCERFEFHLELAQHVADAEGGDVGLGGARIEMRDLQQRAEDILDGFEGRIDVGRQRRRRVAQPERPQPLPQRGRIEARGAKRLQQVVTGRRKEARLRHIGVFGLGLGANEFDVQPFQLVGALPHAAFKRQVLGFELFLGGHLRRRVGVGEEEAAVVQAHGAHIEDAAVGRAVETQSFRRPCQGFQTRSDRFVDGTLAIEPTLGVGSYEDVERHADAHELRWQLEHLAIGAIPGDQEQVGIEDGHAVTRDIDRMLKHVAAVLDLEGRIVDDLPGGGAGHFAFLQQQGEDHAR